MATDLLDWRGRLTRLRTAVGPVSELFLVGCFLLLAYYWEATAIASVTRAVLGPDALVLSLQIPLSIGLLVGGLAIGARYDGAGAAIMAHHSLASRAWLLTAALCRRAVGLWTLTVLAIGSGGVIALRTGSSPSIVALGGFVFVSLLYGWFWIAMGAFCANAVGGQRRMRSVVVLTAAVGLLWKHLATGVYSFVRSVSVNPFFPPADGPLFLLRRIDPRGAYLVVTNWLYGVGNAAGPYQAVVFELHGAGQSLTNVLVVEGTFPIPPAYLHPLLAGVVLLGWCAFVWVIVLSTLRAHPISR